LEYAHCGKAVILNEGTEEPSVWVEGEMPFKSFELFDVDPFIDNMNLTSSTTTVTAPEGGDVSESHRHGAVYSLV